MRAIHRVVTACSACASRTGACRLARISIQTSSTCLVSTRRRNLPGERKDLFPGGVPGVTQGIPPEYVKGNQPPPETAQALQAPASEQNKATEEVEPEKKAAAEPEPKPKPKRAAKPRTASQQPAQAASQPQQQMAPWPQQNPQPAPQQASHRGRRRGSRRRHRGRRRRSPAPSRADTCSRLKTWAALCGRTVIHAIHSRHCWPPQCRQVDPLQQAGRPPAWPSSTTGLASRATGARAKAGSATSPSP